MTNKEAIRIQKWLHNNTFLFTSTENDVKQSTEIAIMAIKALEQEPDAIHNEREQAYMKGYEDASKRFRTEPCEDAISRQAVLDLCERFDGYVPYSVLSNYDMLPSVSTEKTGRWIPVSERLPEIGQYVLCSLIKANDVKHRVIICEYKREVWWSYVTAWMPLPQPYNGESEEISDRNLKMWIEIFAEEKRREERK